MTVIHDDCIKAMGSMNESTVDAIVTDPPYNLAFMGKEWDRNLNHGPWVVEALRVLKPGGHLLAFGGTRTYHRLACAIEDAGFEIRDSLMWCYGQGFPKSLDVSKAIDKAARRDYVEAALRLGLDVPGNSLHDWTKAEHSPGDAWWERFKAALSSEDWQRIEREVIGHDDRPAGWFTNGDGHDLTAPATPEAQQWNGWGTALKPAHEPIVMARKPLVGTVAQNVTEHGTGALNVDGCRVGTDTKMDEEWKVPQGRWPANLVLDEHAAAEMDRQSGERPSNSGAKNQRTADWYEGGPLQPQGGATVGGDSGGASRFFYVAKASRRERNAGLEGFAERVARSTVERHSGNPTAKNGQRVDLARANHHPTVKPIALMRWLCRLVTPPGGLVLDPFTGSGTTGCAAALEGFDFIGIEREAAYAEIAQARIAHWADQETQLALPADLRLVP